MSSGLGVLSAEEETLDVSDLKNIVENKKLMLNTDDLDTFLGGPNRWLKADLEHRCHRCGKNAWRFISSMPGAILRCSEHLGVL